MANAYIEGKDRVAADESFPYPIKLTYDDDYIYLKVLSIPNNLEIIGEPRDNSEHSQAIYSGTSIYLCLESSTAQRIHKQGKCNAYKEDKHPSKGGKFFIPGGSRRTACVVPNPEVGRTYSFEYYPHGKGVTDHLGHESEEGYWYKVRGTFRIGRDVDWVNRTGVYSNTAIINVEPEE